MKKKMSYPHNATQPRTDGGHEQLEFRGRRLVRAVAPPHLLHGLVGRPRQLKGDVHTPALIGDALVRLQRYARARSLAAGREVFVGLF